MRGQLRPTQCASHSLGQNIATSEMTSNSPLATTFLTSDGLPGNALTCSLVDKQTDLLC